MKEGLNQSAHSTLHASYIAFSASAATLVTKSVLHPLDTLKCRLQSSKYHSFRQTWSSYSGHWGPKYLYSGLPVKLAFYIPYQTIYMTSYSMAKESLTPSNSEGKESRWSFLGRTIAAATAAELSSCVVRVPMETVKMRIQALIVHKTMDGFRQMHNHGFSACMRLVFSHTFVHDIPYSAIQWCCYETFSPLTLRLLQYSGMDCEVDDSHSSMWRYTQNFVRYFLSGGFSALIASTVTLPLDSIRTRVAVATSADPTVTVSSVVRNTYRLGGVKMFFRGANTRVLWVTSNMALYFPLFETFKIALLNFQLRQEAGSLKL